MLIPLGTALVFVWSVIATFSTAQTVQLPKIISGPPRVVDGDTIRIGEVSIRLEGIDAPETDQICLDAHGQQWTCGVTARDRLRDHISGREIQCARKGYDR